MIFPRPRPRNTARGNAVRRNAQQGGSEPAPQPTRTLAMSDLRMARRFIGLLGLKAKKKAAGRLTRRLPSAWSRQEKGRRGKGPRETSVHEKRDGINDGLWEGKACTRGVAAKRSQRRGNRIHRNRISLPPRLPLRAWRLRICEPGGE